VLARRSAAEALGEREVRLEGPGDVDPPRDGEPSDADELTGGRARVAVDVDGDVVARADHARLFHPRPARVAVRRDESDPAPADIAAERQSVSRGLGADRPNTDAVPDGPTGVPVGLMLDLGRHAPRHFERHRVVPDEVVRLVRGDGRERRDGRDGAVVRDRLTAVVVAVAGLDVDRLRRVVPGVAVAALEATAEVEAREHHAREQRRPHEEGLHLLVHRLLPCSVISAVARGVGPACACPVADPRARRRAARGRRWSGRCRCRCRRSDRSCRAPGAPRRRRRRSQTGRWLRPGCATRLRRGFPGSGWGSARSGG
jgi:hypothetical protein